MNGSLGRRHSTRTPIPQPPRPRRWPISVLALLAYSALVFGVSLFAGKQLYDWARDVAVRTHPLPQIDQLVQSRQGPSAEPIATGGSDEDVAVRSSQGTQHPQPVASQESLPFTRLNILLLGTDGRRDEKTPPRTDTIIVATLDLAHQRAGIISLPRDLWVPIPGYDITTKINTAYTIGENRGYPGGGAQLTKDTVSSFIGRPIEYYVRINFQAFVEFVDLIGGIDVDVPETIHDEKYPTEDYGYQVFHIEAGRQHMDGATALKYVRTRNTDNDYKRAQRQQQVIRAILNKVLQADMIPTLVAKAPQLLATMRDSIDTDIPLSTAVDLANYIRQHSLREMRQLVLDNRFGVESYSDEGAWILIPDRSRIRPALNDFFETPQDLLATAPPIPANNVASAIAQQVTDPDPQDPHTVDDVTTARVEILNGTGYPGVADRVRTLLEKRGWQVVRVGEADRSDYRRTLLVNYRASDELVQRVGQDLSFQSNLPKLNGLIISDTVDLRIVVGQDFLKNVLGDTDQR